MEYTFHPAANLFPLMDETALNDLAEDIREHGLHHAVVLHENQILDGRNRYLACQRVGVEPHFEQWKDTGSPTAWVLSENLHRRHLTSSQKATIAVDAMRLFAEEARRNQQAAAAATNAKLGRGETLLSERSKASAPIHSRASAAAAIGVAETQVQRAITVKKHAPELFEQMKAGTVTATEAVRQLEEDGVIPPARKRPDQEKKKVERFTQKDGQWLPNKPAPPASSNLHPGTAKIVDDALKGLAVELFQEYPALILSEWNQVCDRLRERLEVQLASYRLVRLSAPTAASAEESGNSERSAA